MRAAIERLSRRILLTIGRGRIQSVDDSGTAQIAQVVLGPLETQSKLKRLAEFGFTSRPPKGSDAIVLFVGGDRGNGVIIATGNQQYRLKNLGDGEVALYNSTGRYVKLGGSEIVVEAGGGQVTINNATKLLVHGDIEATGNVKDATRTMAADRAKYNAHKHSGVTTGAGVTGITDTPE